MTGVKKLGVDDEVWEYNYDNDAVIPHIFKTDTIYYKNGKFILIRNTTHPNR